MTRRLMVACFAAFAFRAGATPDLQNIRFDQHVGGQLSPDIPLVDEAGRSVTLRDYFGGKPMIIVPGYYGCPMLCTLVANGMIETLQELRMDIGRDFLVLHISIDPRDTPGAAAAKKQTYLKRYGRPGAADGWHFLTGSENAERRVMDELGFRYVYDPESRQYAHPSGLVLVTPEGKIARYFFGVNFDPGELQTALRDASAHRLGSPIEQLVLLCFHYNPITGKYGIAIMNVLRLCAVATVCMLGAGVVIAVKRERARRGAV